MSKKVGAFSYRRSAGCYYLNTPAILFYTLEECSIEAEGEEVETASILTSWELRVGSTSTKGVEVADLWQAIDKLQALYNLDSRHKVIIYASELALLFHLIKRGKHFTNDIIKPSKVLNEMAQLLTVTYNDCIEFRDFEALTLNSTIADPFSYIKDKIDREGASELELTLVSELKRSTKRSMYNKENRKATEELFNTLFLNYDQYTTLEQAFWGGFSFTNPDNEGITFKNVVGYDENSCYLAQQFSELYPMALLTDTTNITPTIKQCLTTRKLGNKDIRTIAIVTAYNVECKASNLAFINADNVQAAKVHKKAEDIHAGHIMRAKQITLTLTDIDLMLLQACYKVQRITLKRVFIFEAKRLPNSIVKPIIDLYKHKTELKAEGKQNTDDYTTTKAKIGASFGMHAQTIGGWGYKIDANNCYIANPPSVLSKMNAINKEMNKRGRWRWLPWAIYTSAYARYKLLTVMVALTENGQQYLRADTDSAYIIDPDPVAGDIIKAYNEQLRQEMHQAVKDRQAEGWEDLKAEDIDSQGHLLGAFELDGIFKKAKSLQAKCHLFQRAEEDPKASKEPWKLTLAGCGNKEAMLNLLLKDPRGPFTAFDKSNEEAVVLDSAKTYSPLVTASPIVATVTRPDGTKQSQTITAAFKVKPRPYALAEIDTIG